MDKPSRIERLAALAAHAHRVQALAHPTTAYLLRVLTELTTEDIEELSHWHLNCDRAEGIVDRLTADLGENRQVVREVLGKCLRLDL